MANRSSPKNQRGRLSELATSREATLTSIAAAFLSSRRSRSSNWERCSTLLTWHSKIWWAKNLEVDSGVARWCSDGGD